MRLQLVFLSSILLSLPACLFRKPVVQQVVPRQDVLGPWVHIAQLVDVPPAPGAEVRQLSHYSNTYGIHYYLTLSLQGPLDDIADFYHSEMDSLGWQEIMLSSRPEELVMVYLKPSRICMIHAQGTTMRIVVAPNGTQVPTKISSYDEA
jgi:hypothetical protein